jgi:tetratricopeptide (TPR) repeat protein
MSRCYKFQLVFLGFSLLVSFCGNLHAQGRNNKNDLSQLEKLGKDNKEQYAAQFLDVQSKLKASNDQEKLIELYRIHSDFLLRESKYDSVIRLQHIIRSHFENKKGKDVLEAYLKLALVFHQKDNYDSLLYWQQRGEKLISPKSPLYGKYLLISSYLSSYDGNYLAAIQKSLEAIDIFQAINDLPQLASAYASLAYDYDKLGDYQKQREYIMKAIEINRENKNSFNLIQNYNNIGTSYRREELLEEALAYYDLAFKELQKLSDPFLLAQNLTNRANILEKLKKYEQAERLFLECKKICEEHEISYGIMLSNLNLGNLYRMTSKFKDSFIHLNKALFMTEEMKLRRERALSYERLSWLYRDSGNYKSAYEYLDRYHALNDSLVNESVKKEANELKEKYESEKKEREILALSRAKLFQQFVIAFILFVFFVTIQWLVQRHRLSNQKKAKEQQQLKFELELKDKELLADSLKKVSVMHSKAAILDNIKKLLVDMPKTQASKFNLILKELKSEQDEQVIQEFETRFLGVYDSFFERLKDIAPELTPAELRVAALLRLNFSSKEIAALTNRTVGTVENLRSNLRKKLKLEEKDNLIQVLLDL